MPVLVLVVGLLLLDDFSSFSFGSDLCPRAKCCNTLMFNHTRPGSKVLARS